MLKVLIVDDETWVCQLIKCSIDWEQLDMEVVDIAHDGEEGIQKIALLCPDIVITDVRMPVVDGISMIERVRESGAQERQPHFIIISGYQDFEYAQKALRYDASDYILKPYNEEQLFQALSRLREKIGLDSSRQSSEQAVRKLLGESLGKLRESGLYSFFRGKKKLDDLEAFNREFSFAFQEDNFGLYYIRVDSIVGSAVSRQLIAHIAEHFVIYFQNVQQCGIFTHIENGSLIVVLSHPPAMDGAVPEAMKTLFSTILGDQSINRQVQLSMGYTPAPVGVAGLPERFLFARDSADCRLLYGSNRIYDLSGLSLVHKPLSALFPEAGRMELTAAVESFDGKKLREVVNGLYQPLLDSRATHPRNLYELAYAVVEVFCAISRKMNVPPESVIPDEELLFPIESCKSITDFPNLLNRELAQALATYHALSKSGPSKPVQTALKYIERHYAQSIRLGDIAAEVYLTPQYFSELFKSEVGINFTDYLANYRIEAAKKLLATPGEKVKDICAKVGYSDAKSFSKVFKKCVGLSPREYQRMFS